MRWFVITAVSLNIVLSNLCMMPVAYASATTQHDDSMELVMTPAVPMTSIDCEGCVRRARQAESIFSAAVSHCDSGHCFEQGTPLVGLATASGNGANEVAVAPSSIAETFVIPAGRLLAVHSPPERAAVTTTVVLRL